MTLIRLLLSRLVYGSQCLVHIEYLSIPGLRWIFEALTGGDLSGLPSTWFSEESDKHPELSQKDVDKKFEEVKATLKHKEHIIVGHNLFTDLVCIYKTFIGPLPTSVEAFQERIHSLFPIVIDTKYLATDGHGSMSTVMRKSLAELLEPFKTIHTPLVLLHEQHTSYGPSSGKAHEAGFDSTYLSINIHCHANKFAGWMTAELFIKLSSQIYADRKRYETFDSDSDDSRPYYLAEQGFISEDESGGGAKLSADSSEEDLLDKPAQSTAASKPSSENFPPAWHSKQLQTLNISDNNPYSVLQDGVEGGADEESDTTQRIPSMGSSFWDLYANKLRVNASDKGVCVLNEEHS